MKLVQLQRYFNENGFLKIIRLLFLIISCFALFSCFYDSTEISTHMSMTIKKAYLFEFLLPNDPEARLEEVDYYQFLKRYRDGNEYVYLFAWEVYDDTGEWQVTIGETTFYFEHEVKFIVYRSQSKSFHTVKEAIDLQLFTIEEFSEALESFDVYISKS